MLPSRQDYTKKEWFFRRTSVATPSLLRELVPNFRYLIKFKQNTANKLFGVNERMDAATGYVFGWDRTHRCDRCGKKLRYNGSRTIQMAWSVKAYPWLKHCGLCQECNLELEKAKDRDKRAGIIAIEGGYKSYARKIIPDTYRRRYIWL